MIIGRCLLFVFSTWQDRVQPFLPWVEQPCQGAQCGIFIPSLPAAVHLKIIIFTHVQLLKGFKT